MVNVYSADFALGARIRSLREVRGLSTQAFAGAIGVSWQQVEEYEVAQASCRRRC